MANNYTITFKSLRAGTVYTLNIGGGTGAAIPLKGGAPPFTTQEDDSDDMFTPIRTQTGYIRIEDDGKDANGAAWNWKDLLPATDTSRPVTLTANGTVVWQGFMQAQNFGGVLYGNPQEREFPVQCPLTALSASDVDATNRELRNFAYIIKQAFDNLTGITINNFIFQGGTKAQDMLLKLVDWQNLVSEDDGVISGRYDNLQVLTDVCAFWGWTCRTCGQNVYFTCADDATLMSDALILSYAQLGTMAGGVAAGSTSETFLSNVSPSGDIFASVDNAEYLVRGYNLARVTADGNSADENVMEAYPTKVEETMINNGSYTESYNDCYAVYTGDLSSFTDTYLTGSCNGSYATFNKMLVKKNMSDPGSEYNVVRIRKTFISASQTAFASFETVFHHSYYDTTIANGGFDYGGINIYGDVFRKGKRYEDYDNNGVGKKHIYLRVGIGKTRETALWWTGSAWSSTVSAISIRIGDQSPRQQLLSINTNANNLQGKLFVDFLGSSDIPEDNNERRFEFVGFQVTFTRRIYKHLMDQSVRKGSSEYKASNNSVVRDEWNADCIYASDNDMLWGYGVIMNDDGKWLTTMTYGTQSKHPEQHLADRVAAYSATSKQKVSAELRTEQVGTITPRNTVTLGGVTGHAISISHEWRDDITQLTTMQV